MAIEIFYPYNESFREYGPPRAGLKRAQAYCDERNQYKGGHYVVHTKAQYEEWYEKTGRSQEVNAAHRQFLKDQHLI